MRFFGIQEFIVRLENSINSNERILIIQEELSKISSYLENDFNTGYNRHKIRTSLLKLIYIQYCCFLPQITSSVSKTCESLIMTYGLKVLNLEEQKNKVIGFFALSVISQNSIKSSNDLILMTANTLANYLKDDKPEYLKNLCINYIANSVRYNTNLQDLLFPLLRGILEDKKLPSTTRSKVFYVMANFVSSLNDKRNNNYFGELFNHAMTFGNLACKYIRELTIMWPSIRENDDLITNGDSTDLKNVISNYADLLKQKSIRFETRTSYSLLSAKDSSSREIGSYNEYDKKQMELDQLAEDSVDELGNYTNNLCPVSVKLQNKDEDGELRSLRQEDQNNSLWKTNSGMFQRYNNENRDQVQQQQKNPPVPFWIQNKVSENTSESLIEQPNWNNPNKNVNACYRANKRTVTTVTVNGGYSDVSLVSILDKIINEFKMYDLVPSSNIEREQRINSVKLQCSRRRSKWALMRGAVVYLKRLLNELFVTEKNYMYSKKSESTDNFENIIVNSLRNQSVELSADMKLSIKLLLRETCQICSGFLHTLNSLNVWPPNAPVYHYVIDPFLQFNLYELMQHHILIRFYTQSCRHLIRSAVASILSTRKFEVFQTKTGEFLPNDKNYTNIRATLLIYIVSFVVKAPFLWSTEILDDCIIRLVNLLGKSKGQRSNYLGTKCLYTLLLNITSENKFLYDHIEEHKTEQNIEVYSVSSTDKTETRIEPIDLLGGIYIKIVNEDSMSPEIVKSSGTSPTSPSANNLNSIQENQQRQISSLPSYSPTETPKIIIKVRRYDIGPKIAVELQNLLTPQNVANYDCTTMHLAMKSLLKLAEYNEIPFDLTLANTFFVLKCLVACRFDRCVEDIISSALSCVQRHFLDGETKLFHLLNNDNTQNYMDKEKDKENKKKIFIGKRKYLLEYMTIIFDIADICGTLFTNNELTSFIQILHSFCRYELKHIDPPEIIRTIEKILLIVSDRFENIEKVSLTCIKLLIEECDYILLLYRKCREKSYQKLTTSNSDVGQDLANIYKLFEKILQKLLKTIIVDFPSYSYKDFGTSFLAERSENSLQTKIKFDLSAGLSAIKSSDIERNNSSAIQDRSTSGAMIVTQNSKERKEMATNNNKGLSATHKADISKLISNFNFTALPEYNSNNEINATKLTELEENDYLKYDKLSVFSRAIWVVIEMTLRLAADCHGTTEGIFEATKTNLTNFLNSLLLSENIAVYLNQEEVISYIYIINNGNSLEELHKIFDFIAPKMNSNNNKTKANYIFDVCEKPRLLPD